MTQTIGTGKAGGLTKPAADRRNMSWLRLYARYHKFAGSWAFILHRLSGLALVGYLFMHIYSLRGLQEAIDPKFPREFALETHPWTEYVRPYASGVWLVLEWLLFSIVLFHALNGIRIAVVDLAGGSRYHRKLFWGVIVLGIVLFAGMGALIFGHIIRGV